MTGTTEYKPSGNKARRWVAAVELAAPIPLPEQELESELEPSAISKTRAGQEVVSYHARHISSITAL
jgi:hypothetical protein